MALKTKIKGANFITLLVARRSFRKLIQKKKVFLF